MSSLYVNAIDSVQYPAASKMANRCVTMLANLWHAPPGFIGTETVGSTEGCYLGVLAMKKNWQLRRKNANKPLDKYPNIIMGHNSHIAWHKACSYFDIEPRFIELTDECLVMDPLKVPEKVDEYTIGVAAMFGSTYNGQYEDIEQLNQVLKDVASETGLVIPVHVDAAGGGLFSPLISPEIRFDFLLDHVNSISFSSHKYGFTYANLAFVVFRSKEAFSESLRFTVDYLGKKESHILMNFSHSGAFIAAQYYNFVRLGKHGYRQIFHNLMKLYHFLVEQIEATSHFEILSTGDLPVIAFRLKPELKKPYDEFDIMHRLKEHRFFVPAYKMAPNAQHIQLMRVCIRLGFDMELAEDLVEALKKCIEWLDAQAEKGVKRVGEDGEKQHGVC